MPENAFVTVNLGRHLAEEIDEALGILQSRGPKANWTPEKVVLLAITHGLREILRKNPRSKVTIPGHYRRLVPEDTKGERILIDDISLGGLRFRALDPALFRENEVLDIQFDLAHKKGNATIFHRKVIVSHLTGNHVGVEFCETDDAYHKISGEALQDYLVTLVGKAID